MRKGGIGLLVLGIILLSGFAFAAESGLDRLNEQIEEINKAKGEVEKTASDIDNAKWEYLSAKWNQTLMGNKYVRAVDGFLNKIDFVFIVLLGQDYSLSFNFFMPLFLWFIFWYVLYDLFKDFSSFSKRTALFISLGLTIIIGQLGILRLTSEGIFRIMFYKSGWWPFISTVLLVIVLVLIIGVLGLLGKQNRARKKKFDEMMAQADRKILHTYAQKLTEQQKNYGA